MASSSGWDRPYLLLIHHDRKQLLAARHALRKSGFRVVAMPTAREALNYLRQGGPVDLMTLGHITSRDSVFLDTILEENPRLKVLYTRPSSGSRGPVSQDGLISEVLRWAASRIPLVR